MLSLVALNYNLSRKAEGVHYASLRCIKKTTTTQRAMADYLRLTKPRVVALLLLTAVVGMALAQTEWVALSVLIPALTGIGLMSATAAAINHLVDRHIDAKMARTLRRPLPQGNLSPFKVSTFASIIGLLGFATLYVWVNALTAWLTFASMVGYAVVYTMFLKRAHHKYRYRRSAGAAPRC